MRFRLILENEEGLQMDMTDSSQGCMVSEIDGLYPPTSTLATASFAGANGSLLTSAYVEKRNLVISFHIRGPFLERSRQALYQVVQTGCYVKVYYQSPNRDVFSEGYVETCSVSHFTTEVQGQISILCPFPYWQDTECHTYTSEQIDSATHQIVMENQGAKVGIVAQVQSSFGEGSEFPDQYTPFLLQITNEYNNETFTLRYHTECNLSQCASIILNTKSGEKSIVKYDKDGDVEASLMPYVDLSSTWLSLPSGVTSTLLFTFNEGGADYVSVQIVHRNLWLGV